VEGGERGHGGIDLGRERPEVRLDLRIARLDQSLGMPIALQRLTQGEEVLRPVVPHQGLGDGLRRGLDAVVPVAGEHRRVPLPREDRVEDGQTRDAGNVAEHMVQLEVHLGESLLQVRSVGAAS
jgi:hypothetical protein